MPTDPRRQKQLFEQALERPPHERAAFLDGACGDDAELRARVDALLASLAAAADFLTEPPPAAAGSNERPGGIIDRYKLLEQLGEGGFGVVWMAEQQEPVRRKVALKVIKLGMDTRQVVARFEAERQALALMDHPNIAKVLDGGITPGGRPYFVMELIKGVPITEYCDQAALGTPARLELFQQVCHAVQHAHQKGVIHRDLKPGNILVTLHDGKPVPKVIDFGIAKATSAELTQKSMFTEFRQMVGTPEYMAPEQAELSGLDVDTRADVYSLGVVLYELLTGSRPFEIRTLLDKGYLEMLRVIREEYPQKPSTRISTLGEQLAVVARRRHATPASLSRLLRGDLDWIVMQALEKDRDRRYATANDFAADIGRHLQDQPVHASPPSAVYRLRKYVRRHRAGVLAGAVVTLALVAGLAAATWGWLESNAQRARATNEAERSKTVVALLEDMLGSADPMANRGPNYTVRELLDEFDRDLGARLEKQPAVLASLHHIMGGAFHALGQYDKAALHRKAALDGFRAGLGDRNVSVATCLSRLADVLGAQGNLVEAEKMSREALAMNLEFGLEHASLADNLNGLGVILIRCARVDEAKVVLRQALRMNEKLHGREHQSVIWSLHSLANCLQLTGELAEAEPLARAALAVNQRLRGNEHPDNAVSLLILSTILKDKGEFAEAEKLARDALDLTLRRLGDVHPNIAASLELHAGCLLGLGRLEESEKVQRQALDMNRRLLPASSVVAASLIRLANLLRDRGEVAEAEQLAREALDLNRLRLGNAHPGVGWALQCLADVVWRKGDRAEAASLLEEALLLVRNLLGDDHRVVASVRDRLSDCLLDQGRFLEAAQLQRDALAIQRKRPGDGVAALAAQLGRTASVLVRAGELAEAETLASEFLGLARDRPTTDDLAIANALVQLGQALLLRGKYELARPLLFECLEIRKLRLPDSWLAFNAMSLLGAALLGEGKHAEAEPLLLEGHDNMRPPPEEAFRKVEALQRIVELYEGWGRPDEAATWRAKLPAPKAAGK